MAVRDFAPVVGVAREGDQENPEHGQHVLGVGLAPRAPDGEAPRRPPVVNCPGGPHRVSGTGARGARHWRGRESDGEAGDLTEGPVI